MNRAGTDRCTVAIVTAKPGVVDNNGFTLEYDWSVMSLEVSLREGESQDSLLRRFQRMVQVSGVLREAKTHRYFISKKDASRIKAKNNARRKRRLR